MTHLTDEQLRAWQGAGRGGDEVIAHLAECDDCGARLADMVRNEPIAGDALLPNADVYVQRGYAAFGPGRRLPWRAISIAAGIAAAILLAVIVPGRIGVRREPLQRAGSTIRGGSIRAIAPIGAATPPLTFSWSSPVQAASYRVEIDEGSALVVSVPASGSTVTLGAESASRLTADRSYRWRVVALAADGTVLAESDWTSFRLSR